MSRIITASEVDRLHERVSNLEKVVAELRGDSKSAELFEGLSGTTTAFGSTPVAADPVAELVGEQQ